MSRQTVSSAQLYAIFDREFRRRKPKECATCMAPLPFYRQPADDVSANWDIGTPAECPHLCRVVMAELLATLWSRYDIEAPEKLDA